MSQVETLLLKARDNLDAARLLLGEDLTEIAASRAYYAMFYVAEALLFARGLVFSSHSAVLAAYGKEFAKPGLLNPEHHRHLLDAFEARQLGDYGLDTHIPKEQVQMILSWAEGFSEEASKFLAQDKK
ncbi:MAG: HEPN domain-containing protein [Anaerolineales bacterium]